MRSWIPKVLLRAMNFRFRNLYHLLRIASIARPHALIEESALHRIARKSECFRKVLVGSLVLAASKLEFAKRRRVKRIRCQAIEISDGTDLFQPTLRTVALSDCDSAIERDYWGRTYLHQRV